MASDSAVIIEVYLGRAGFNRGGQVPGGGTAPPVRDSRGRGALYDRPRAAATPLGLCRVMIRGLLSVNRQRAPAADRAALCRPLRPQGSPVSRPGRRTNR